MRGIGSNAATSDTPTGTVTFLFTDIEGSTRLLQKLGPRYHGLLVDHHGLMREAFREGYVAGTEGDAFFVVFRSPGAALRGALEAQRAIRAHMWPDGIDLRVRMGLHTGEAAIAGGDYVGIDVNRAARIAAAGHGCQILVSAATRAIVGAALPDDVSLRDLGEHRLKDLRDPEHLFQVVAPDLPVSFPPPRGLTARIGELPTPLTPFIGREEVLEHLGRLCHEHRLVTLTGPGGTGKTRLALQVASDYQDELRDGAALVPLAPIVDPGLVPETIARALEVLEEPGRPMLDTLGERFADAEALLVFDNFEQVIDAAPVVSALLAAAPGLRVIVTSREPLRVDGEHEFPVPPMDLPDPQEHDPERLLAFESAALFVERATSVDPGFVVDSSTAGPIAAICARLDGLPLAIELAAARVRLLTPTQLLERLDRALPMLGGGGRDRPERQQTLRGAIGWSHDLLDDAERWVFRRLAVFRGGCTFDAAERVCRGEGEGDLGVDVLDVLGSLVDKSLVRLLRRDEDPRFVQLYVIQEYALERLEESDEAEVVRRRHADTYLDLVAEVAPKLFGADQAMWLDRLQREQDNLRSALTWAIGSGETVLALRLIGTSWRFWQMRGHLREARERVEAALAMPETDTDPEALGSALEAAGGIAYWTGDWAGARAWYDRALAHVRVHGEPLALGEAAYNRACIGIYGPGEFREPELAAELLDEALEIFRAHDHRLGLAKVLWASGGNLLDVKPDDALPVFRDSLALYRELGDRFGEAWALHMLGLVEAITGAVDDGERHMLEAFDLFLAADDRSAVPILLGDLVVVAIRRSQFDRALTLHGAALALESRTGVGIGVTANAFIGITDEMWQALPEEEARRHVAIGESMSADEAIAYALKREG